MFYAGTPPLLFTFSVCCVIFFLLPEMRSYYIEHVYLQLELWLNVNYTPGNCWVIKSLYLFWYERKIYIQWLIKLPCQSRYFWKKMSDKLQSIIVMCVTLWLPNIYQHKASPDTWVKKTCETWTSMITARWTS